MLTCLEPRSGPATLKGRGEGGLDFLALLAFIPTVISSFFAQNKGGPGRRAPPLDPPLLNDCILFTVYSGQLFIACYS